MPNGQAGARGSLSEQKRRWEVRGWLPIVSSLIIVCAISCFLLAERSSSQSVDITAHYSLVDFYWSRWGTKDQFAQIHATMADYPPIAHMLAALVGRITGSSPFLGMQLASLIFLGTSYVLLFFGALSRNLLATFGVVANALLGFYIFWNYHLFFGNELSGNFFFAHVGSTAAMLAILFVLSDRERSWAEIVVIPATVYLLGWLYPLAQIQVAAGASSLWLMAAAGSALSRNGGALKYILGTFLLTALSAAAFRLHPLYELMRAISNNNGGISARISVPVLCVAAVILLFSSCVMAVQALRNQSNLVHPKFLAAAGFAASLSFLAHAAVFFLTRAGSDYAVLKHTYSVVTILVIQLLCLAARAIVGRQRSALRAGYFAVCATLFVSVAAASAVWITLSRKSQDIGDFLRAQNEVRALAASDPSLYMHAASQLLDISATQNFIITAVDLRSGFDTGVHISLDHESPAAHRIFRCIVGEQRPKAGACVN